MLQAPESEPPVRRAHRVLVPVLLVVATIVGIGAAFAVWVNRQALNTNNWSSTSAKILEDKQVQTALSAYLVHELFTNVNVSAELQTILPKPLQPLAGPAAAGLQQLAGQLAPKVLATPQVQATWVQANIAAHKELLKVLNGGGPVVSTKSGVVTLNLQALVSQLAATLGVSSQVAAVKQKLGITVPPSAGQLVIMRSDQLKSAQDIANAVKSLAIVLPVIALLLFALAVYLARGRRRQTLRTTGWCFVMIGIALLLIRRVGGDAVVNGLVKVASNKPAVHDVWNVATSLLFAIAVAMIVYGLLIVAAAWLAGPTRPSVAIRKALAPPLRDSPAVAYAAVGGLLLLVVLWGPTPAFRNVWWILVFAGLLALGVTMLRRETQREFPGIAHRQAPHDVPSQRAHARAGSGPSPASPPTETVVGEAEEEPPLPGKGRIRRTLSGWRVLARIAYRDPQHVAERLTLYAAGNLGQPSLEWAQRVREQRPDVPRAVIAEELRTQTAQVARIDGAVSGTPFLIALVPGYLAYLREEGRMVLRTAALYDRDPRELETSAEVLVLRGVHPNVDAARAALEQVRDVPLPDKPVKRRSVRTWVRSVTVLLIFGGFLSAPSDEREESAHPWLKASLGFLIGAGIWVTTWVLPATFMVAMAWGCETHARQLGRRALLFYDGDADSAQAAIAAAKQREDRGHGTREILRAILLVLSIAVPIGFVAYADHVRQSTGINWVGALGALAAVSLVLAASVLANRR